MNITMISYYSDALCTCICTIGDSNNSYAIIYTCMHVSLDSCREKNKVYVAKLIEILLFDSSLYATTEIMLNFHLILKM